jgi:hypothetical protein
MEDSFDNVQKPKDPQAQGNEQRASLSPLKLTNQKGFMGDNLNQTSDQSKNFLNRDEQSIFADTKICPLSTLDFDDDQSKS